MHIISGVVILGVLLCCSILANIYIMNLRYQERNKAQAKLNVMSQQSCNISSIMESLHQTNCDLKCTEIHHVQIHGFGGFHCMPKTKKNPFLIYNDADQ